MVRPRASDRNLSVAVAFGNMIVVRTDGNSGASESFMPISCNGGKSIFAVFAACLPDLARDSRDKHPANRHGVTAVELNKALHSTGLKSVRRQERLDGTDGARWRPKVWANCRWMDPSNPMDIKMMAERLFEIQRVCPEMHRFSPRAILEAVARVVSHGCDDNEEDERGRGEDSSDISSQPSKKQNIGISFQQPAILPPLQMMDSFTMPTNPLLHYSQNMMLESLFPKLLASSPILHIANTGALTSPTTSDALLAAGRSSRERDIAETLAQNCAATALNRALWEHLSNTPGGAAPSQHTPTTASDLSAAATSVSSSTTGSTASSTVASPAAHPEVAELRAQVQCLEGQVSLPARGEHDAAHTLLADRNRLAADKDRLAAECKALREERDTLLNEVNLLRRHRSG